MSKWPMRGHFQYLRFKTFPMTLRTPQCKVFWALLLSSKHSGVPEDSKSPTFPSVGLHPHTWPKWGCDKYKRGFPFKITKNRPQVFWGGKGVIRFMLTGCKFEDFVEIILLAAVLRVRWNNIVNLTKFVWMYLGMLTTLTPLAKKTLLRDIPKLWGRTPLG
jgi:hypothetical protein